MFAGSIIVTGVSGAMPGQEQIERRLAAILVADVVDYSAHMERDEEGTLARLHVVQREIIGPRVSDHNGRIVKTAGDGFLVEFPSAPLRIEASRPSKTSHDKFGFLR